jgi:hypothetical protein
VTYVQFTQILPTAEVGMLQLLRIPGFKSLSIDPAVLTDILRCFNLSHEAKAEILP